jgi:3D (Asp-Asp-Asp) domain-containing protein
VTVSRRGSTFRTLVILGTLVPAWHSAGVGFFHGAEEEVLAASGRFEPSSMLPYPSVPIEFVATAYCESGITKSGVPVEYGLVAADPTVLPLGSWIHIENPSQRGIYQVMDTGRLIKGKRIDIYLPTWNRATQFGRQRIQVTVLKYGRSRLDQVGAYN